MQRITHSEEETFALAASLAGLAFPGAVIALWGPMGAGKTAFTRGFARGLGLQGVSSPTFALFHVHEGPLPLYHFDLYRLEDEDALETVGADEFWFGQGVSLIEWPQRAGQLLPQNRLDIEITPGDGQERSFALCAHGEAHQIFLGDTV